MANIYELTGDFLKIMEMLQDSEIDEETLLNTLECVEYEIEQKAEGYAKIIKSIETDVDGLSKEIERLSNRKITYENKIKWLKQNLYGCMKTTGKTKFKTDLFSFNIQKNGGKRKLVVDVDIDRLPEDYRIKQPDAVDGDKIRELLKENGTEREDGSLVCEYGHLEPQGESLRIK